MSRRVVVIVAAVAVAIVAAGAGWYYLWRDTPIAVTGATLYWTSGMNHPEPVVQTTIGAADAQALADAISGAPRNPHGTTVCPDDDGSRVVATFGSRLGPYPSVTIALTGCPGPNGKQMTAQLRRLLRNDEPPDFHE